MELKDLKDLDANIVINVSLKDLRKLFKEIASETQFPQTDRMEVYDDFYSRKEVLQRLNIDPSTLWKWEKTGYVKSYPLGGRKRYSKAEVNAILTGKKS